ncbi:MAG: TonB-dependent receptor, partial [Bryobacteraceae bacterium]|nr:TonB-dependent receptor [Bryobacteraceae bacterium]
MKSISILVLMLAVTTTSVYAQSVKGVLLGSVTDSTGLAVPGASVSIVNAESGAVAFKGTTTGDGSYTAPALPVGVYHVSVEAAGFKKVEIRNINLKVDERVRVNARLDPGVVTEQITVSGAALGQLQTETSSISEIINVAQMQSLPLANGGRGDDVLNVLMLAAGVSAGGNGTRVNAQQISINGSRTLNTEITVDGVSILSGTTGSITMMPSREAIREVKVLTSAYSAEYGRTSGGFVNAVVDSGTSQYHGALYHSLRNEAMNANGFFNNVRGVKRPRDRLQQFGGKLGGPVVIPKIYNGQNRSFFFFNYEGLRIANPGAPISTVPDAGFRSGNFAASRVVVRDPATGAPFPGNLIPGNRIDPAAAKILGLVPLPNSPGTADIANGRLLNNYVNAQSVSEYINNFTGRYDHSAMEGRSRTFLRITQYDQSRPAAAIMPGPLNNERGPETQVGWQVALGYTHVLSPNLLLDLSAGLNRNNQSVDPPEFGLDPRATFGIDRTIGLAAPTFNISGYRTLGLNGNTLRRQITNTFNYSGALNWSKSGHLIKVGAQLRRNQFNVFNPGNSWSGTYNFNGEITNATGAANNPVNALADFLLGSIATAEYKLPQPLMGRRNWNLGVFLQDDWKITSKLTLNLGLRYEYESPMVVVNDVYSRIDDATGRMLVAGKNASRSLNLDASRLNFAPRIGLALSLNRKTVIRAASGLFFGQIFSNLGGGTNNPGFTIVQSFPDLGVAVPQAFRLSQGFPLIAVQNLDDPFAA